MLLRRELLFLSLMVFELQTVIWTTNRHLDYKPSFGLQTVIWTTNRHLDYLAHVCRNYNFIKYVNTNKQISIEI